MSTFLFGDPAGFWPEHPLFTRISRQPESTEFVLAEPGAGKTAFARALVQIGEAVNSQPFEILPVYLSGRHATAVDIGQAIIEAMDEFVAQNQSIDQGWRSALNETSWLEGVEQTLKDLGFRSALLIIDFNERNFDRLEPCLKNIEAWTDVGIVAKIFAPMSAQSTVESLPFNIERLAWVDHQLREMAYWRLESVARMAGVRIPGLSTLFEAGVYTTFFVEAQNNPRRLARLWRKMLEDHYARTPAQDKFTLDNLTRVQGNL